LHPGFCGVDGAGWSFSGVPALWPELLILHVLNACGSKVSILWIEVRRLGYHRRFCRALGKPLWFVGSSHVGSFPDQPLHLRVLKNPVITGKTSAEYIS
jgi:hypothetical protein